MTKPLPFTESRVRRAIAAMRKEGLEVSAVSIHPDGTVTIHRGTVTPVAVLYEPTQDRAPSKWADAE
jgi:hypothetical protein